jgi:hypothetical protein
MGATGMMLLEQSSNGGMAKSQNAINQNTVQTDLSLQTNKEGQTTAWIVVGDKPGNYDVTASVAELGDIMLTLEAISTSFELGQNYPNPFNRQTSFPFGLPEMGRVTLDIFDSQGARVTQVVKNQSFEPGNHVIVWDAAQFASGSYFYRVTIKTDSGDVFTKSKPFTIMNY